MLSVIATALIGSWTYAGFLDEPTTAPRPPAVIIVPDTPEDEPTPDQPDSGDSGNSGNSAPDSKPQPPEPKPDAEPKPAPEASPRAAVPTEPSRYRLADAWGQVWEHPDLSYLRTWIENRNRLR